MKKLILGAMMMFSAGTANAADITLPQHSTEGGMPLMEAMAARRSGREFDTKMLSDQHLADLLWATWGISSPDGRRVVPTARNTQDIDLYVLLPFGSYRYDAANNVLKQLGDKDLRSHLASQPFAMKSLSRQTLQGWTRPGSSTWAVCSVVARQMYGPKYPCVRPPR